MYICVKLCKMETTIGIRISKQLRKSLEKLAQEDKRKLSDYIRVQLENIVEQKEHSKK